MAYGLEVDNLLATDKGLLVADVLNIVTNSSKAYPEWSGRTLYYSISPINSSLGHTVTIVGTTVSWTQNIVSSAYFPDTPSSLLTVYVR